MLHAFVHIATFCGLRWVEIAGLTLTAIDLDRRLLRMRHGLTAFGEPKAPKTRAGVRDVPMPEHVAALLRRWIGRFYLPNERELLFHTTGGKLRTATSFHMVWKALLERAGIPRHEREGHHHFHALRHFRASALIEKGCL